MENRTLSKAWKIRVVSYVTALVLVLGAGTAVGWVNTKHYKMQLENSYLRSIEDTATYVTNISTDLTKGLYAGTPSQMSSIAAKLWRESSAAKAALSGLPLADLELDNTYRFLSQVGDYAMAMTRKSLADVSVTQEDRETLAQLRDYSATMMEHISALEQGFSGGEINLEEIGRTASMSRNGAEPVAAEEVPTGYSNFEEMEQSFEGYPTLIYDGPFSDHIAKKEPTMLIGAPAVSREEARVIAAKATGVSVGSLRDGADENSHTPSYLFEGDNVSVGVTKNGGFITYMVSGALPGEGTLSKEEAYTAAKSYLAEQGFESLEPTYYDTAGGKMTINFAYLEGDVICYTDLVKVSVSMDSGKVVSLDARGYIVNHMVRELPSNLIAQERAQKAVSPNLTVENVRLALIPSIGLNELLCYEFTTRSPEGQHVLVYINAQTGTEEQILLLQETETGTLTQ